MQVTDQWMQTMQLLASAAQNVKPPQSGAQSRETSFRDLMEQKQQQTKPTDSAKPSQSEGEQAAPEQTLPNQDDAMIQQMELAAALVAQTAVVVMPTQPQQAPTQQVAAVEVQPELTQQPIEMEGPQPQQPLIQSEDGQQQKTQTSVSMVETQTQDAVQAAPQTQNGQGKTALETQPQAEPRQQGEEIQTVAEAPVERPLFQNAERAPIKVADAPVMDTQDPQMEAKLTNELTRALDKGEMHVELRLAPEHLGNVVVELTRSGDGTLQVLLRATDPKAVSLLKDHSAGLSTLLQSSAHANVQIQVQQEQAPRDQQQPMWQQQGDDGRGQGRQQQQQRPKQEQTEDFLQQLRLGLVGVAT